MSQPVKSNAALIEDAQNGSESKETEIVQEYKNLNEKCEAVLDKINKRKKTVKTSKK